MRNRVGKRDTKHSNKMKAKKSREERCKHKIIRRCVIEEETEELSEKSLCDPPSQINLLENKVGVHK